MVDYQEVLISGLKGVARTHSIHESLSQSPKPNLDEIKPKAREAEAKITQVAEQLISQEFFLDDKTIRLVNQLQEEIKEKFPQFKNAALVVLGSSLHGGRLVREVLETDELRDLDLTLFHDFAPTLEIKDYEQVTDYLYARIQEIKDDFGFGPYFELCDSIKPKFYNYCNFHSPKEVLSLFPPKTQDRFGEHDISNILFSFFPSFPPEVNQNNQGQILEALNIVFKENPKLWDHIVKELARKWKSCHQISLRHLTESYTITKYQIDPLLRDIRLKEHPQNRLPGKTLSKYYDIITASEETMVKHFQTLLESTKM